MLRRELSDTRRRWLLTAPQKGQDAALWVPARLEGLTVEIPLYPHMGLHASEETILSSPSIQSRHIQARGVVAPGPRPCSLSCVGLALACAVQVTTPSQKAATGPAEGCENGSPGDGRSSPRRSSQCLFRWKARTGRAQWPDTRPSSSPHRPTPTRLPRPALAHHKSASA